QGTARLPAGQCFWRGNDMSRNLVWAAEPDADAPPAISVRDYIDRLRYEDSLLDFIGASWRLVEPTAFLNNWHIDAICEHLEAAADWQINRLLINIPPRHMKSLGANVFFPAWVWAQDPNTDCDPKHHFQIRKSSWRGPCATTMYLSIAASPAHGNGVKGQ